jgi:hypothetical protein
MRDALIKLFKEPRDVSNVPQKVCNLAWETGHNNKKMLLLEKIK